MIRPSRRNLFRGGALFGAALVAITTGAYAAASLNGEASSPDLAAASAAAMMVDDPWADRLAKQHLDEQLAGQAQRLQAEVAEQQAELAKQKAQAAARAEAARQKAAAEARAQAAQRAARSASRNPKAVARAMLGDYGWGSGQFACLDRLWTRESNWNPRARNPYSGAYGIPQALPGRKMAKYGSDWRTNPVTQIKWGLSYIDSRYGSPCDAWSYFKSHNWY